MNPILEWGIPVIQWMQSLGTWLQPVMQFFTFLGTENFYLLILPIFLWWIDTGLGIRIGVGLLFSAIVNTILKTLFGLPRPYWVSTEIHSYSSETSFGLPSGHAQNAVVLWGLLAGWSSKRWVRVALVFLIALIALSRTYLGVHFPSDTIAGLLVGSLILWVFIRFEIPVISFLRRMSVRRRLVLVCTVSLLVLGLGLGSIALTQDRTIPPEWISQAADAVPGSEPIDPLNASGVIANVATLFGVAVGAVLLTDWGEFDPHGTWPRLFGRYFVGLLGLALIFLGLRFIFPTDPFILGAVFRFIRYALVGFWVAYLAPRLFVTMRLA